MTEENKKVKLYSYSKVWKIEKKIYSIQNIVLPVPVNPYSLLSFLLTLGIIVILDKVFPVLSGIPVVIRYGALPYFISNYLMKKKLDGMNPFKYFAGVVKYLLIDRRCYIEQFRERPAGTTTLRLTWNCSRGYRA